MTQQEYYQKKRECWEEYFKHVVCSTDNPKGWFERAFDRAYALGKQETKQEIVIQGWVVRDKDGTLNLFYGSDKPIKRGQDEYWSVVAGAVFEYLPREMFPDLTWDSEPLECEIIIKRKKK